MARHGAGRPRHGGRAVKIVVTGPFAAGKSTLIRTVSEISVLSTERGISDSTRARKAATTVAMDFGRISIDSDLVMHLFGTPGQERFDFMWDILGEGMIGFVLLIDGTRLDSLPDAAAILRTFRAMAAVPYVIAVNRTSSLQPAQEAKIRVALAPTDGVPVVACDATDRESVKDVLLALLHEVDASLPATAARR